MRRLRGPSQGGGTLPVERPFRPRRTLLYTPGNRPERIEKVLTMAGAPDMVVADLEDGVGPGDKATARKAVADVLSRISRARPERCVRINAVGTRWHAEDLAAAVGCRPDVVVVPKLDGAESLGAIDGRMRELEAAEALTSGAIRLIVQLETPEGVANAFDIGRAARDIQRVAAFVFGAEDYAAAVGARRTTEGHEVLYARSRVVLAAAIAGVAPIDQVFADYKDRAGLVRDCQVGRDLGFEGKQMIHPDQIAPVHDAFTPSSEEIARARELLAAAEEAGIGQGGAIGLKGRMVDRPVVEQARRVVAMAEALGVRS